MTREWPKRIALIGGSLLFSLVMGEVAVRLMLHDAPMRPSLKIEVEPAGSHMYLRSADLGYTPVPNQAMTVTLPGVARFHTTTTARGTRATSASQSNRPEVWVFGCSYTFGWGVNDDESYPWKLQELMPDVAIVNFGVPGYGTLQSLIQFENELAQGHKPAMAVLAYVDFHKQRNVMSPSRSKYLGLAWRAWGEADQPYATIEPSGELKRWKSKAYEPYVPFVQYSALANLVDWHIIRFVERRAGDRFVGTRVTRELVRQFIELGKRNGVQVVVADLSRGPGASDMADVVTAEGSAMKKLEIPYEAPGMTITGDGHPTPKAQAIIAAQMRELIASATGRAR